MLFKTLRLFWDQFEKNQDLKNKIDPVFNFSIYSELVEQEFEQVENTALAEILPLQDQFNDSSSSINKYLEIKDQKLILKDILTDSKKHTPHSKFYPGNQVVNPQDALVVQNDYSNALETWILSYDKGILRLDDTEDLLGSIGIIDHTFSELTGGYNHCNAMAYDKQRNRIYLVSGRNHLAVGYQLQDNLVAERLWIVGEKGKSGYPEDDRLSDPRGVAVLPNGDVAISCKTYYPRAAEDGDIVDQNAGFIAVYCKDKIPLFPVSYENDPENYTDGFKHFKNILLFKKTTERRIIMKLIILRS